MTLSTVAWAQTLVFSSTGSYNGSSYTEEYYSDDRTIFRFGDGSTVTIGATQSLGGSTTRRDYTFAGPSFGTGGTGHIIFQTSTTPDTYVFFWQQTVNGVTSSGSCTYNGVSIVGDCGIAGPHHYSDSAYASAEEQNPVVATNNTVLRAEIGATIRGIGARISQATGRTRSQRAGEPEIMTGVSAGDPFDGQFSTWGSLSGTRIKQGGPATAFEGRIFGALLGADVTKDGLVTGVALSLSRALVDTDFNNGKLSTNAVSVAPYVGYAITDWLTVDGNLGIGRSMKKTSRNFGTISGDATSGRFFAGTNLTAYHDVDQLRLQGSVGYTYAIERTKDFIESNGGAVPSDISRLGTLSVGGRVGYEMATITPYVSAKYLRDVQKSMPATLTAAQRAALDDKSAFEVGLGFDMTGDQYVLTAEVTKELAREEFDSVTALLSLRYRF